jgi:hypothetical protein
VTAAARGHPQHAALQQLQQQAHAAAQCESRSGLLLAYWHQQQGQSHAGWMQQPPLLQKVMLLPFCCCPSLL